MGDNHTLNNPERNRINLWCTKIVHLSIFIVKAHSTCSRTPFVVAVIILGQTKGVTWKKANTGRSRRTSLLRPRQYSFARADTSITVIEYHEQVTTVKFNLLLFKIASIFN